MVRDALLEQADDATDARLLLGGPPELSPDEKEGQCNHS